MVAMSEHLGPEGQVEQSPWDAASGAFVSWRTGDATAVDELVRVMTPVLWQVVRAYGHDQQSAQDIIQSTWVGFVRLHQTIEEPKAVASWLITSARRGALDHSQRSRRAEPVEDAALAARLPDTASAETLALLDDEAAHLWRAVAGLDERCRKLVRIVAFQDRPDYAAISQDLQMPVGSNGPTRARCLGKLRTALTRGGDR
jgi:RNA polymerase sigma factor (sigma-70 family)